MNCVFFFSLPSARLKITLSLLRQLIVYSISYNIDQTKPVKLMTFITYINTFKSILLINRKSQ